MVDVGRNEKSFDREAIENLGAGTIDDVLKPRARFKMQRDCKLYYLDGHLTDMVFSWPLDWVFEIEAYTGYFDTPIEYHNPTHGFCGAVLIWSNTIGNGS